MKSVLDSFELEFEVGNEPSSPKPKAIMLAEKLRQIREKAINARAYKPRKVKK